MTIHRDTLVGLLWRAVLAIERAVLTLVLVGAVMAAVFGIIGAAVYGILAVGLGVPRQVAGAASLLAGGVAAGTVLLGIATRERP